MPIRESNIRGIRWIDWTNLNQSEIYKTLKEFDFHELDIEAVIEKKQRTRIDSYENYMFIVLHFPKYDKEKQTYRLNEFDIFLWKNFLITLRRFETNHVNKVFEKYSKLDIDWDPQIKITTGYILYEIIQSMLEKMFKLADNIRSDLKQFEKEVFTEGRESLVKWIMIKKRNIIVLRHIFAPQVETLKNLEININNLFRGKMEVYFEDLEDKIEYIVNDTNILSERVDALEDTFKSIVDIKTNFTIKILTIFSAFMLPLTLVTSFYWMNVDLPFQNNALIVYLIIAFTGISTVSIYQYFKIKKNF